MSSCMNLGELQTALMRYGFDTNDPLTTWINAAMHEIETWADWPFMVAVDQVTLQPGVNQLPFSALSTISDDPTQFSKVMSLKDLTNLYKLRYFDRRKFTRDIYDPTEVGLAEIYTIDSTEYLTLWRTLQAPATFEVVYQVSAIDLGSSSDTPSSASYPWPATVGYAIVQRAAAIALMAENEEDRATTAQNEFQASMMRLIGRFSEANLDEPSTVEDAQGYNSDYMASRWSSM